MKSINQNIRKKTGRGLLFALCISATITAHAQDSKDSLEVKGAIVEQNGELLSGVAITSSKTRQSTSSRKGTFKINTVAGDTLLLSLDGFDNKQLIIADASPLSVTMVKESEWNRIIPLTWGMQRRRYTTGSFATVAGSDLKVTQVGDMSNLLQGLLPGLTTSQTSAEPGYSSSSLAIRGLSTFGNSGINTYIDGVERDFTQLDPGEIETIEVLKDAAANAMLGINGANRAIWVTTKKGRAFQNKISFTAQGGIVEPTTSPKFLNAYNYAVLYNEARTNDGFTPYFSPQALDAFKNNSDPYLYPNVDWRGQILKNSTSQQRYTFTMSGGNNSARYFILLGYSNQPGIYNYTDVNPYNTNANFKRYNFRTNLDISIDKKTSVSLDMGGRVETKNYPGAGASSIFQTASFYPPGLFPMLNKDSSIGGNNIFRGNPYGLITSTGYVNDETRYFLGTARITRSLDDITKGLSVNAAISFDNTFRNLVSASQSFAVYQYNADSTYTQYGISSPLSDRSQGSTQNNRSTIDASVNYERDINKGRLKAVVTYYQSSITYSGVKFPYKNQQVSGRFNYTYNQKYIGELGLSYSGSENFAPGKRFGLFPVVSAAWILSEEDFIKSVSWVDFLKVRASYGVLGNGDVGFNRFPYIAAYNTGNGSYFGVNERYVAGVTEGALGNYAATWEKSKQFNLGIDGEFFNHQLSVSVDFFNERRTDILAVNGGLSALIGASEPVTYFTNSGLLFFNGASLPAQNIGIAQNRGLEWNITHKNNIGRLGYSIGVMGSFNKSKIIYASEPKKQYAWEYMAGNPIGQPFGLEAQGLFQDQADIDKNAKSTYGTVHPGDIKYKDQNGDGFIDVHDIVPIGKTDLPQLYYGIQLGITYKGFDLSALFQGVSGRSVDISTLGSLAFYNGFNATDLVLNRWTPATAATATFPRLSSQSNANNYQSSTYWQRSGDYLKLRNIELGYTIKKNVMSHIGFSNCRIYINGFNLFTASKLKKLNLDPEYPYANIIGYPLMKGFNAGIKLEL